MSDLPSKTPKRLDNSKLLDNQLIVHSASDTRTKESSWWSSLTPSQRNIVSWTAITLGISLVAALGIFFAKKVVQKKVSDKEEDKSLGDNNHATWAKQIKNAFDNNGWWGTDEELLRRTLRAIPSKEDWSDVKKSYSKIYKGANLVRDMTGELKQTEYDEMLAIINSKPATRKDVKPGQVILDYKGWARRLHAALSYNWLGLFWGTDEDAVKAVFMEIPSQKSFKITGYHYDKMFGSNMVWDLKADMDNYANYYKIIKRKPYSIYNK